MLRAAIKLARKLNYKLFQAPKGYGQPVEKEMWEKQYKEGFWNFLDSIDELANYMVTVGYVRHFAKSFDDSPKLLDIGCGHGNLAELLSAFPCKSYLGLDLSEEAIKQASSRNLLNAEFQTADFEKWERDEKFDFILSTGSISYADDPIAILKKFENYLTDKGIFIVSLWRYGHNGVIWQNIEKNFEIIDSTIVTNHKNEMWDIKVFR